MSFRPESFRSNAEDLVALFDQVAEMEQRYSSIRLPIRMIAGTHDTIVLSTIHAMSLEAKVPGARLRYVPGAGHPIHHFAPELISAEIRAIENPPAAAGMKSLA